MSTFAGLTTAYLGVTAQQRALGVVAQNIANATTPGYTRQRIETSAIGPLPSLGPLTGPTGPGHGVSVDGVSRLANTFLEAQVRQTSATQGYAVVRASELGELEAVLNEPSENGLSAVLDEFWAAWSGLAARPGEPSAEAALLGRATAVVERLARGHAEVASQWAAARRQADELVDGLNSTAAQLAELNTRIRSTAAAGGSVNELLDQRAGLAAALASLAGGQVRERPDGTLDVLVGGNPLVEGGTHHELQVRGAGDLASAGTDPVRVVWSHRPDAPVGVDGGQLGGTLAVLAPGDASGAGGALAAAAASYDAIATRLARTVNTLHSGGLTTSGAPAGDFFGFRTGTSGAAGLTVIAGPGGIATGAPGGGALDGSVAEAIAGIGTAPGSPDEAWTAFVTRVGTLARAEKDAADLAGLAATSAQNRLLGAASVDLDEETLNMLTYQRGYEASARVLTAIDEMLDVLINRTGVVGR